MGHSSNIGPGTFFIWHCKTVVRVIREKAVRMREIAGFVRAQARAFGRVSQRKEVSLSTTTGGHIQLGRLSPPILKRSRSGTARSGSARLVQSAPDSWRPQESSGRREAKCAAGLPDDRDSVIMSSIYFWETRKASFYFRKSSGLNFLRYEKCGGWYSTWPS